MPSRWAIGVKTSSDSWAMAFCRSDEDDPDVPRHPEEDLPMVLGLEVDFLPLAELHPLDLGEAIDNEGDVVPEALPDLVDREVGVLDRVVEEARGDSRRAGLELGQDVGHFDRVLDIGFPGLPEDAVMLLLGQEIGVFDHLPPGFAFDVDVVKLLQVLEGVHRVAAVRGELLLFFRHSGRIIQHLAPP